MSTQSQSKVSLETSRTPLQAGLLQRKCDCGNHTIAGGECTGCEKKHLALQRVAEDSQPAGRNPQLGTPNSEPATSNSGSVPPIVHEVLRSSGQPIDHSTRAFFEPRFGYDFSRVRVHTDVRAAKSTEAVSALAYTVGQNVVLAAGSHSPESTRGRDLLAHELTHTIQQRGNGEYVSQKISLGDPDSASEREADNAVAQIARNQRPQLSLAASGSIARVPFTPAASSREKGAAQRNAKSFASGLAALPRNGVFSIIQAKFPVASEHDPQEQTADRVAAEAVNHRIGDRSNPIIAALSQRPSALSSVAPAGHLFRELPADAGRPLSPSTRDFAESAFGIDFSHVRLHSSQTARTAAASLGARAFAQGQNIWLGPGESESDKSLMAHELTHVVQQRPDMIYLRSATWLERRAWLAFFDQPVPRRLLNNYMDDTGATINLSLAEMIGCNPVVDVKRSPAFMGAVGLLRGGGSTHINFSGWGGALTNGTLGNFTINYAGTLVVSTAGNWSFNGMMNFYDYWDFDPKPFGSGSGRPVPAEIKVRVASAALPGRPFNVTSVTAPIRQTNTDRLATWGAIPTAAPDRAARTGTDIEVGGAGGGDVSGSDVGLPDVGEVGGGESGAQSSEDLNR